MREVGGLAWLSSHEANSSKVLAVPGWGNFDKAYIDNSLERWIPAGARFPPRLY